MAGFGGRVRHWGSLAFANPWAFLATFTAGAAIAFLYSYVPLHNVKDRKIETLSGRVVVQETEIDTLERSLLDLREAADDAPDPAALAALDQEGATARAERDKIAGSLEKAEKRITRLERERRDWRRKVDTLEQERDELLAAGTRAAVTSVAADASADALPAKPSEAAPEQVTATTTGTEASVERAVAGAAPPVPAASPPAAPAAASASE